MRALKILLPALAISLSLSCSFTSQALAQDSIATDTAAEDTATDADAVEDEATEIAVIDSRSLRALRSDALGATDAAAATDAISKLAALAATDPEAAYVLGEIYLAGGEVIEKDPAKAVPLLEVAGKAGDARAFKRLGDLYRAVEGFQAPLKAYENYKSAADLGDASAAYRAGDYLRAGEVVPRDISAAVSYYEIAAAGGNTPSLMRLGDTYRAGSADGLNLSDAVPWYEKAGAAGNAQAYYRLGEIYRSGLDGTPQPDLAVANYQLAADAGNTPALMRLAQGLLNGNLASGRESEGFALLQQASADGVSGASLVMATAQLEGTGTTTDTQAGLATLGAAADAGDVSAARYLIQLYTSGRSGVRVDLAEARNVLDSLSTTADPAVASFETVIVNTASKAGFTPIGDVFGTLDAPMKQSALNRVYAMDRNAYVYLVQRRLTELGLYSGTLNGLMTSSTITGINQLCATHDITNACRLGPLSSTARRSIAEVIFQ